MNWFRFKSKKKGVEQADSCENTNMDTTPEAVKPPDGVIDHILNERFSGVVARQWVNWASEQIGEEPKYFSGYPMTVRSLWVLYEGCRIYVEGTKNERSTNSKD